MTLEDLGNIGEMGGGVAVMISLIYLAIQIRQSTTRIRENSRVSRLVLQENFVSAQQDTLTRHHHKKAAGFPTSGTLRFGLFFGV